MVMKRRGKGDKLPRRTRWVSIRAQRLIEEGFSPNEAARLAEFRISTPSMRRLRRRRKGLVQRYLDREVANWDQQLARNGIREGSDEEVIFYRQARKRAIDKLHQDISGTDMEITDWDSFRRNIYPKGRRVVEFGWSRQ